MSYSKIFQFYIVRAAKFKWYFFLLILGIVIHGFYPSLYSYSSKLIFDILQQPNIIFVDCIKPIVIFCSAIFLLELSYVLNMFIEYKVYPHIHKIIITDMYDIIQYKQYTFFQKNQYGSITSKVSDSIYIYDYIIEEFIKIIEHVFVIIINTTSLLMISWKMGSIIILFLISAFVISYFISIKITHSVRIEENAFYGIIGGIADRFINIFSILSFFSQKKERNRLYNSIEKDFIPKQQRSYRYKFYIVLNIGIFYLGIIITAFIYSIYLKTTGKISLGDISLAFGLAIFLSEAMLDTSLSLQSMLYEFGRIKSVFEVIDDRYIANEGKEQLVITKPLVEFRNVTFKYPDIEKQKNILDNFSLKINAGEHIGIIGESGVGKSSLISLILGLFKCNSGEILISDINIDNVTLKSLRTNISIIPQDTILFNRSIMENLKYGSDCSDDEVIFLCKQVGLHNAIINMSEGYDSLVGERGSKLSGGQRQRVSIVRAMLKKSPILLLDEATSALDPQSEYEIHNLINEMFQNVTMIVVAHRLMTIKNMDRIIFLKDGKIVEEGSHNELFSKDSLYKRLWNI